MVNDDEVPCPYCGKMFRPHDSRRKFCSAEHAFEHKKNRERERSRERRSMVPRKMAVWTPEQRAHAAEAAKFSRARKAVEAARWAEAADRIRIAGLRELSPYGSPAAAMMEA